VLEGIILLNWFGKIDRLVGLIWVRNTLVTRVKGDTIRVKLYKGDLRVIGYLDQGLPY
jgi:hypothetical protein